MPSWPATLPQSLEIASYAEAQRPGVVRTSMDAGPDFVRRRFTAVSTSVSGSMTLTEAQWVTLMTFFNTTLAQGSLPFDWHPRGQHQASPQVIYTMRFVAPPTRSVVERYFAVDLSLEILP
jgi:hypothetical protein